MSHVFIEKPTNGDPSRPVDGFYALKCDHANCDSVIAGRGNNANEQRRSATLHAEQLGWQVGHHGENSFDACPQHVDPEARTVTEEDLSAQAAEAASKR